MVFTEVQPSLDYLREVNKQRLVELEKRPIICFAYDVHGFALHGKELLHDQATQKILDELARLLSEGCVLAAVTGFSDRINIYQTNPLRERVEAFGLIPESLPFYLSTRNGALTTHGFNHYDILDEHPIDGLYDAITSHRLVKAIHAVTNPERIEEIFSGYRQLEKELKYPLHPRHLEHPGIRHDFFAPRQSGYQLTLMYEPDFISRIREHDQGFDHVCTIAEYSQNGVLPAVDEMAAIVKDQLAEEGILVNTNTATSHPEIDIALPHIHKGIGCAAVFPRIMYYWQVSADEALENSLGGGDSPAHNDRSLIKFFKNGITNRDYWAEGLNGPIVLDYPEAKSDLERTYIFLSKLTVRERPNWNLEPEYL